jgi:hypothetical protein
MGKFKDKTKTIAKMVSEMPSLIPSSDKRKFGVKMRVSWIFAKDYEKIILVLLCMLGVWKIIELIQIVWRLLGL